MKLLQLIVLLMILVSSTSETKAQTRLDDSLALVMFYDSCCNTGCTLNWDFNQSMDNWTGVTLGNGRVIRLQCNHASLTGSLLDMNLTELVLLELDNNNLVGVIPNFNYLPNLRYLYLSNNQLTGSVPSFINVPLLEYLSIIYNQLSGQLPSFNLSNLTTLWAYNNQLSGNIPNFTNTPSLTAIWLSNNQFSGSIPDFSNMPDLQTLDLGNNQLTGSIPSLTGLPNIGFIAVNNNQLSGRIPSFSHSQNLTGVLIEHNQFTFGDIIPSYDSIAAKTQLYWYNPQVDIGAYITSAVPVGSSYTIDLVVDDTLTTNTYLWTKNNVPIDTLYGINEYVINNFQAADVGVYRARIINSKITNPMVSEQNLVIRSRPVTLSLATSVAEVAQVQPLTLTPNPVQDMAYITAKGLQGEYQVSIYDAQGQEVEQFTKQGDRLLMVPFGKYPAGLYIVRLTQGEQVWQQKLIKR